jgi:hypothetical protein
MQFFLTSRDELNLPGMRVSRWGYYIRFSPDGTKLYNFDGETQLDVPAYVDPTTLRVRFKSPVTVVGGQLIEICLPENFRMDCTLSEGYRPFTDGSCFSVEMGDHSWGPGIEPA